MLRTILKTTSLYKTLSKTTRYARWRATVAGNRVHGEYYDDSHLIGADVPPVLISWPAEVARPRVGVVRDPGPSPRWTKYLRFLNTNGFESQIYDIHSSSWLDRAADYDVIIGVCCCAPYHLEQARRKAAVLESELAKVCYPSVSDLQLYEDKFLEAYRCRLLDLPFIPTFISNDVDECRHFVATMSLPAVSKIVPSSGSVGVELVRTRRQAARIVRKAFSGQGRATHTPYLRQKDYVYFQQYIETDGYDLRVIVVDGKAFGYYRKSAPNDFRASGMGLVEKRELPVEAIRVAEQVYAAMQRPMLVVDLLRDREGRYWITELSPLCQVDTAEQLHVAGVPGAYTLAGGTYQFCPGRYWIHELALRAVLHQYSESARQSACAHG